MGEQGFVPFGEWMPDARYLINSGLLTADGVVPVYGSYITAPTTSAINSAAIGSSVALARGLHIDKVTGNAFAWMDLGGSPHTSRIFRCTEAGVVTDYGGYTVVGAATAWYGTGCNFGNIPIMADLQHPIQYLAVSAVNFADMITSAFKPRAQFVFGLRNNLFVARCQLDAGYDGLPSGNNLTLIAWSASDNIRSFGSFNADPQFIGAGYQALNFDIGDITGAVAGADYAFIAHSNGFSRIDGPPYSFRVVCNSMGTVWPYGMCMAGSDVYVMSQAGLLRFNGGDGRPDVIGTGKFIRSLIDDTTGFSAHPLTSVGTNGPAQVSMAHDPINDIIFIAYCNTGDTTLASCILAYNIQEDRASWFDMSDGASVNLAYPQFLRSGRNGTSGWCPGRDIRFVMQNINKNDNRYARFILGANSGVTSPTLGKGYIQFKTGQTTRITRIRPIYSTTDGVSAIEQIVVNIKSTNKPYALPTTYGPYTSADTHGWISTPSTVFADFHAPQFVCNFDSNLFKLTEFEGFEYEIELGPVYAA